ncbi:unnamed protein product [Linum trigynum]|uniref:Uncharacterized protein n=1 Tax=Linum trigynum TaxID=586398 RepID=A0AAV2CDT8_9ROSI
MGIDVVERSRRGRAEESLLELGELEVSVFQEEEHDLELGLGGGEVGEGGRQSGRCITKEGEVLELIGGGDWDGGGTRGEDSRVGRKRTGREKEDADDGGRGTVGMECRR